MNDEEIFRKVLNIAFRVHTNLGPGLLESVYESCLVHVLKNANIRFERQKIMPLVYDDEILEAAFRLDLLIENRIIIEIKSVEALTNVHLAQILT